MREAPRRGAASSLLLTKRPFDYLQASANSYTETVRLPERNKQLLKYTKMTRTRKIIAASFAIVAIAVIAMQLHTWATLDCCVKYLIIGLIGTGSMLSGLWFFVDQTVTHWED